MREKKSDALKIGMIGMSPGNAHPYSWSAIINGVFDGAEITRVGYPAVTDYLVANQDTLGLANAKVTHVWAQDRSIAESIAKTADIGHVVDDLEEMASQVDAVILARDDPENHVEMSKPFITAGVPIFIDKPLAFTTEELKWYKDRHAEGSFFMSCSSMRYANECRTAKTELKSLGKIELVTAVGKKDWPKYGVHMLEAVFALLGDPKPVSVQHVGKKGKDIVYLVFEGDIQVTLHLFMNISGTFQLSIFGEKAWRLVEIKNSYSMFRDNIIEFVRSVELGKSLLSFDKTENIIKALIGATESLNAGGTIIQL